MGSWPFHHLRRRPEWLRTATPDMAILDAALKDGPCREIALELTRREVPFLIYSGHQEDHHLLAEFQHVTWIEKPVPSAVLVQACQQLLVGFAELLGEKATSLEPTRSSTFSRVIPAVTASC